MFLILSQAAMSTVQDFSHGSRGEAHIPDNSRFFVVQTHEGPVCDHHGRP